MDEDPIKIPYDEYVMMCSLVLEVSCQVLSGRYVHHTAFEKGRIRKPLEALQHYYPTTIEQALKRLG